MRGHCSQSSSRKEILLAWASNAFDLLSSELCFLHKVAYTFFYFLCLFYFAPAKSQNSFRYSVLEETVQSESSGKVLLKCSNF